MLLEKKPEQIGSYRIDGILGRGGMGVVYRGHHIISGQNVALKTVLLPDARLFQSIRQEIRGLARLRHPGIVRIIDEGVSDGLPWYAMELLEGQRLGQICLESTSRSLIQEASTGLQSSVAQIQENRKIDSNQFAEKATVEIRSNNTIFSSEVEGRDQKEDNVVASSCNNSFNLERIVTIFRRLCTTLAYLHGEGIVHRDLKPENIFVLAEDIPVLVDFGLVLQFGGQKYREILNIERYPSGTLSYMAPEQIRGQVLDARADLYALGCLFYTVLTGRPPFQGNMGEVVRGHLTKPPEPPSQSVPDLPPELDQLILRLLAKKPQDRLGYADTVGNQLEQFGARDFTTIAGFKPRPYHYRPRLSGREKQINMLQNYIQKLGKGAGGFLFVGGESGVGKTRLVVELGQQAAQQDISILTGQARQSGSRPLESLRKPLQMLVDRCQEKGLEESEHVFGKRGRILAEYEPSILKLPGQDSYSEAAELPADTAKLRLFNYLIETFRVLANEGPLLLILDDLHWLEELTLAFLQYCIRNRTFDNEPILVVIIFRSDEISDGIESLLADKSIDRIYLERLGDEAVATMIADMLSLSSVPLEFSKHLTRHSEGNPFFIAEYLHTAVEVGLLWRDEIGNWNVAGPENDVNIKRYDQLPMPSSLQELFIPRLRDMTEAERELVHAAAVAGRDTNIMLLWKMVKLAENTILEAVNDLSRRQVLSHSTSGDLHFVHDKIREMIYQQLTPSKRETLHKMVATSIEELFHDELDEFLATLGFHWHRSGDLEKGRYFYYKGARKALKQYAFEQAEQLFKEYLVLNPEPTPESIKVRNQLAKNALLEQGKNEEALKELETSSKEAALIGDKDGIAESLVFQGFVRWRTGALSEARSLFQKALSLFRETGDQASEGIALRNLAIVTMIQGNVGEAKKYFDEALTKHRLVGDRNAEGNTLGNLAIFHRDMGHLDEAQKLFEKVLTIHRETKNRRFEGIILSNFANLYQDRGQLDRAEELFHQALEIIREVYDRNTEGVTLINLSNLKKEKGQFHEAQVLLEKAFQIHKELGTKQFEGNTLASLGILNFLQGNVENARNLFLRALIIHSRVGDQRTEGITLGWLATLARLIDGNYEIANDYITKSKNILESIGASMELAERYVESGFISIAQGNSAQTFIEKAAELVRELNVNDNSETARLLQKLRKAQAAFESGDVKNLFRGECFHLLPIGLRKWIITHGLV